jgi:hypothetical protein
LFRFRAVRSLVLGALVMGAVAWIVSLPAVALAALCGAAAALGLSSVANIATFVIGTLLVALGAALTGSIVLGHGSLPIRALAGVIAACATGPWSVVLGFALRSRWGRA